MGFHARENATVGHSWQACSASFAGNSIDSSTLKLAVEDAAVVKRRVVVKIILKFRVTILRRCGK
jgi:cytochrome c551/c552